MGCLSHDRKNMTEKIQTPYHCAHCGARYEIVRVEASPVPAKIREITCVSCGGPLEGREGPFFLKYFLVDHQSQRQRRSSGPF